MELCVSICSQARLALLHEEMLQPVPVPEELQLLLQVLVPHIHHGGRELQQGGVVLPAIAWPHPAIGIFGSEQVAGEAAAIPVSRGIVACQPQLVQGKVLVEQAELLSPGDQFEGFIGWNSLGGVWFSC